MRNNIIVKTKRPVASTHISKAKAKADPKPRTQRLKPSKSARSRLSIRIHNAQDCDTFITLSFAETVRDDKLAKRNLALFLRKLRSLQCSGYWLLEFQANGNPHFHLMVKGDCDAAKLTSYWAKVTRQSIADHPNIYEQRPIYNQDGLESYLCKARSKEAPSDYANLSRWHGTFGKPVQPAVITVEDTVENLQPVIDYLRSHRSARANERCPGYGFTLWHRHTPQMILEIVKRLPLAIQDALAERYA